MCASLINSNNCLSTNDNLSITRMNQSRHSIGTISLCKLCKKVNSSNQYDICLQCYENQLTVRSDSFPLKPNDRNTNCQLVRSRSFTTETEFSKEKRLQIENEIIIPTVNKSKKKINCDFIRRLLKLRRRRQLSSDTSLISPQSCLYQLILQPQLSIETNPIETTKCPPPPPPPLQQSVSISPCIYLSPERIDQYKQRQIELDRNIKKLMEILTIKTNENIKEILKYWSYLKQICLDKLQPKTNRYQLFDYILKSTYSNKQIELFFEENDEIKAGLQVLTTTLTIIHNKYSLSIINQLFDQEEKLILENLNSQLEYLLSSYTDELSFIRERIHYYQTNFNNQEKNFYWIKILQNDYPNLIEKISNDFILKIPQIEQILLTMIKNMKKHLLNRNNK